MNVQHEPDIDTGNAGDITDVQTYGYILHQFIYDTVTSDPFFANFTVRRATGALPVELWSQVPYLGIYALEEPLTPDGALNQGEIRLTHIVPIGFQFILRNNDPNILLRDLDRVKQYLLRLLLRMDELTNRFDTALEGGVAFNGIARGRIRTPRWGLTGSKNETPVGEQELELSFSFATAWYPFGFPDLERITVITGFPGPGSTPEERQQIQQVKMVYKFDPPDYDYTPPPYPPDPPP